MGAAAGAVGGGTGPYSLGLDPTAVHGVALPVVGDGACVNPQLQDLEASGFKQLPQLVLPCPMAPSSAMLPIIAGSEEISTLPTMPA